MGREGILSEDEDILSVQQGKSPKNKENSISKQTYLRQKIEEMQKRIDELKEKVKFEGEFLHCGEAVFKTDNTQKLGSFGELQNGFDQTVQENENISEKSLYYSASSSYSLCSLTSLSSSTDSAYYNFTKFVSNFVKNQNQKERLSLLQLHSNKQISLNMMRHSLTELDSRCSEELELVERSLQHLDKLAAEFNVNIQNQSNDESALKALEFYCSDGVKDKKQKRRNNKTFIWPPLKTSSEVQIDWSNNPVFQKSTIESNVALLS